MRRPPAQELTPLRLGNWHGVIIGPDCASAVEPQAVPLLATVPWLVLLQSAGGTSLHEFCRRRKVHAEFYTAVKSRMQYAVIAFDQLPKLLKKTTYEFFMLGCHRKPMPDDLSFMCLEPDSLPDTPSHMQALIPFLDACGGEFAMYLMAGSTLMVLHRDPNIIARFAVPVIAEFIHVSSGARHVLRQSSAIQVLAHLRETTTMVWGPDPEVPVFTCWSRNPDSRTYEASDISLSDGGIVTSPWQKRDLPPWLGIQENGLGPRLGWAVVVWVLCGLYLLASATNVLLRLFVD